jgi:hypothetical protein
MTRKVTKKWGWVLCGAFLLGVSASAAPIDVVVSNESRLQTLEKKAAERDLYFTQVKELQKELEQLKGKGASIKALPEESSPGLLSQLQSKALLADQLSREVVKLQSENRNLIQQRDSLKEELVLNRKERDEAVAKQDGLQDTIQSQQTLISGLRETVGQLLLGKFEYYEVKDGETLQEIAANPLIYGDASRALWLRQVNDGRVRQLDDLQKGEMLVIPRFPRNGAYEF